jgi:hypothetical protein
LTQRILFIKGKRGALKKPPLIESETGPLKKARQNEELTYSMYMEMQESDRLNVSDSELIKMYKNSQDEMKNIQIEKATAHWNEAMSAKKYPYLCLDQPMNDCILKQLSEGFVPPVFHSLSTDAKHLLFPVGRNVEINNDQSDIIELSNEIVSEGEKSQTCSHGEISSRVEKTYFTAFFDNNGNAHSEIKDRALTNTWIFDEDYTKTVTELVNTPAKMVGEDIEVTKLTGKFPGIVGGLNLITRRLSRGVVSQCFGESKSESTLAIVGNPGIGKSWTLIYALQQAMLYENVCVVFCFPKSAMAMVCIRKNHKIYVWTNDDSRMDSKPHSALFFNSNVLVLLDPLEAKTGGAKFTIGNRMLIFAASNNKKHFTANVDKDMGKYQQNLSPYSDLELLVSLRYMQVDEEPQDCLENMFHRRKMVGNLPRYLLSESKFACRLMITRNAVQGMSEEQLHKINAKFVGEVSDEVTLAGSIFSVQALLTDNTSIGYDGQGGVQYGERILGLLCKDVEQQLGERSREYILSFWGIVGDDQLGAVGTKVENLFWNDLVDLQGCCMDKYVMGTCSKGKSTFKISNSRLTEHVQDCEMSNLKNCIVSTKNTICRMHKNCALIDFAGPGPKVYQVTVGPDHSFKKAGLAELFMAFDLIFRNKEGRITLSKGYKRKQPIEFYRVVPERKKDRWIERANKTITHDKKSQFTAEEVKCFKSVLVDCVTQYVLVMQTQKKST